MNPEMIVENELDDLAIEDEWADFTADLLSLRESESILTQLFLNPLGQWLDFSNLLNDDEILQKLASLQADCDGKLRVTWLEHPELDRGYCLVLFYVDSLGWNNLALYNKARLECLEQAVA